MSVLDPKPRGREAVTAHRIAAADGERRCDACAAVASGGCACAVRLGFSYHELCAVCWNRLTALVCSIGKVNG